MYAAYRRQARPCVGCSGSYQTLPCPACYLPLFVAPSTFSVFVVLLLSTICWLNFLLFFCADSLCAWQKKVTFNLNFLNLSLSLFMSLCLSTGICVLIKILSDLIWFSNCVHFIALQRDVLFEVLFVSFIETFNPLPSRTLSIVTSWLQNLITFSKVKRFTSGLSFYIIISYLYWFCI